MVRCAVETGGGVQTREAAGRQSGKVSHDSHTVDYKALLENNKEAIADAVIGAVIEAVTMTGGK